MSGCGKSECMGHGHYEVCGKSGQMGIFECDGCKVKHLRAALEEIAKQKLSSQLIPGDGDFECGYDCCVKTAREALKPHQDTQS